MVMTELVNVSVAFLRSLESLSMRYNLSDEHGASVLLSHLETFVEGSASDALTCVCSAISVTNYAHVSEREDKLLAEQMAKLGRENEEISGDEDSEEEEDTGMGEIDVENSGTGIRE
ncbi:hypothetical protein BC332_06619 [Capsicum chinense]|nr:hypothetical protein BC332_06619 [Capsicum chinense]